MKHLLVAATLCVSSFISQASAEQYPVIMYQAAGENSTPVEVRDAVRFGDVLTTYKHEAQGKTNFLVFVKEGLTS
jgi:hypothetical protein